MWSLVIFLIFHIPLHNGDLSREYSQDVYHTLFGDITSMEDLFSTANYTMNWEPEKDANKEEDPELRKLEMEFGTRRTYKVPDIFETAFNGTGRDQAEQEFNKLTKELTNYSRRFTVNDWRDWRGHAGPDLERFKEAGLRNSLIQILIHTRHEVGKALRQRAKWRTDKRYRLGYLFNRLRRLKTEQLKLIYTVYERKRSEFKYWIRYYDPTIFTLIMYEKVAGFDVDIRDTCRYIKEIFAVKEPFDYYAPAGAGLLLVERPEEVGPPDDLRKNGTQVNRTGGPK